MVASDKYVAECMCEDTLITLRYFPDIQKLLVTDAAGVRLRYMRWDGGWNGVLEAIDAMDERRTETLARPARAPASVGEKNPASAVLA